MSTLSWILHETSHEGNVGAAARAIKTMGFSQLILVNPKNPLAPNAPMATALASGAQDILQASHVHQDLAAVCGKFAYVFGLSARDREFGPPSVALDEACVIASQALAEGAECAFLFGPERTGLVNEDFQYCSHRVYIDANPEYPSLNLAQAVMVCAYEMRQTLQRQNPLSTVDSVNQRAPLDAVNALMTHLAEGLEAIEFLDPEHPKKLMIRLRGLFDRAGLQTEEVLLLRGLARQMSLVQSKRFKL